MPDPDGTEPLSDDEYIYRKIPVKPGWHNPSISASPSPQAFNPRKEDTTGLSVDRAKYRTIRESAQGPSTQGYYVAVLRVGDLRANGIEVVPRPEGQNPGHAEIPGLTYENRKTDQALEWRTRLAHELTLRVEGPFSS